MAKVVRLKGHEQREWNANLSILVDEGNGTIVRPITAKESLTMFQMSRQVVKTKQGFTQETPEEGSKVEARLEPLQGGGLMVRFYIDGYVIVGGREAMKSRILAEHGECMLYRTNGKLLCYVRDPNLRRPAAAEANRTTPHPDSCACSKWAGRQEGRHHPVCQHNNNAPPEERGEFGMTQGPTSQATVLAPGAQIPKGLVPESMLAAGTVLPGFGKNAGTKAPVPAGTAIVARAGTQTALPVQNIPHPTACACARWNLPDGVTIDRTKQHHPICEWKDKYVAPPEPETAEATKPDAVTVPLTPPKKFIIDPESGSVLREASAEEIVEAEANAGVITVDNAPYGVVDESAVEDVAEDEEPRPESD